MDWLTDCQHPQGLLSLALLMQAVPNVGKGWILQDSSHEDFGRERAIYFCSSEAKLLLLITAHSPKVMEWVWDLVLCFLYWSLGAITAIRFSSMGECVRENPKPFLQNSNCFDFWVLHVAVIVHTIVCALRKLVLSKKKKKGSDSSHPKVFLRATEIFPFLMGAAAEPLNVMRH